MSNCWSDYKNWRVRFEDDKGLWVAINNDTEETLYSDDYLQLKKDIDSRS